MKSITFKYILVLVSFIVLLASCQKDDALNDHDLFARLSRNGGNWKVVKYEYYDNSVQNPTRTSTEPTDEFLRFFRRTFRVLGDGTLIDLDYVAVYQGNSYYQVAFGAEKERVVFDYTSFNGDSWTVIENKKNKQVWNHASGNNMVEMTLERCKASEFPDVPVETGG